MAPGRKIVVAVDESETSAYAFTWAFHNLFRKDDRVIVLNVAPFVGLNTFADPDLAAVRAVEPLKDNEAAEKAVAEDAKALVHKYMDQCARAGIACEGEVVKGEAGSWIVDEAKRVGANVVCVGSHGYGMLKRTILGSISDYVLHHAPCSVIIVRQSEHLEDHDPLGSSGLSRKVVIAVDGSKESTYALVWAVDNFCNKSDRVIIYHVQPQSLGPSPGLVTGPFGVQSVFVPADNDEEKVEVLKGSEKMVEEYMQYVCEEAQMKCEGVVVQGPTEVKLFEGVKALKADAVVVGYHEHSLLARTFLGSVSDFLSHNSPCPLIAVKMIKPVAASAAAAAAAGSAAAASCTAAAAASSSDSQAPEQSDQHQHTS